MLFQNFAFTYFRTTRRNRADKVLIDFIIIFNLRDASGRGRRWKRFVVVVVVVVVDVIGDVIGGGCVRVCVYM